VQCANQPTYCILLKKQDKQMHELHKGSAKARIISSEGSLGEETPVKDLLTQLGLSSKQVGHWKQCFSVLSVQGEAVIEQGTLDTGSRARSSCRSRSRESQCPLSCM
jgi:hypothetical protein